jgi:hypothetical protein
VRDRVAPGVGELLLLGLDRRAEALHFDRDEDGGERIVVAEGDCMSTVIQSH